MWFTGKLRASVKPINLLLKCKANGSDCVASNKIYEKTPRKTPSQKQRGRFISPVGP